MNKQNKVIYAEVVFRPRTGFSLISDFQATKAASLASFQTDVESAEVVKGKLAGAGFKILASSMFGVSIEGPEKLFNDFFNTTVRERQSGMLYGGNKSVAAFSQFFAKSPSLPDEIIEMTESVYIPRRGYFLAGEGVMPNPPYYCLKPPADISRLTRADAAHSRGYQGTGVMVGMVDSGFIANHDYYNGRGYHLTVHAVVGNANIDEYGHGTGIASNLLAIAPDCDFHFFKMSTANQWATLAAFRTAVQQGCRVITCSWGQPRDAVLEAEIIAAVQNGVTVVFACGNGGPVGWPGCMAEVISVGGAYPDQNGNWQASSYASSGTGITAGRHCPDLSAIVGQAPRGIFIVMPTMIGAQFDAGFSQGGIFPNGDQTGPNDGWLVASGTSSAAPMIAGAAAILLQAKSSLTPSEIRQTLAGTCIDVPAGASASGEMAGIGPDSATGAGMIDIGAALLKVKPLVVCPRAPACVRAPICLRAPVCTRAPMCVRAPMCLRAPVCTRAPFQCVRTPILDCPRGPFVPECGRLPISGCTIAPFKKPVDPRDIVNPDEAIRSAKSKLVPAVVMVPQNILEEWKATEEAMDEYETIGMNDEYSDFPDVNDDQGRSFNPEIGK